MNPLALDVSPGRTVVLDLTAEREDETEGLTGKLELRLHDWAQQPTAGQVFIFGAKGHALALAVTPPTTTGTLPSAWHAWDVPVDDYHVSLTPHWRLPYEIAFAHGAIEATPDTLSDRINHVVVDTHRAARDSRVLLTCRGHAAAGESVGLAVARAAGVARALAGRLTGVTVREIIGATPPGDLDAGNRLVDFVLTIVGPKDQPLNAGPSDTPAWRAVLLNTGKPDVGRYQIGGVYRLARPADVGLWQDFNSTPGPAAAFVAARFPDGAATLPDYSRARLRALSTADEDVFRVLDVKYHAPSARRRSEAASLNRAYQCLRVETAAGTVGYVWSIYEGQPRIEHVPAKCSVREAWTTTVELRAFKGGGAAFVNAQATHDPIAVESVRWLDKGLVPVEFGQAPDGSTLRDALAVPYRDDGVAWLRVRYRGALPAQAPDVTFRLLHLKGNGFDAVTPAAGQAGLKLEHRLAPRVWKGEPADSHAMLLKVGKADLDAVFNEARTKWKREVTGDPPVNYPLLNTVCLLASVARGSAGGDPIEAENLLFPAVQRLLFFLPGVFATALTVGIKLNASNPAVEAWPDLQVLGEETKHDLLVCARDGRPFRHAQRMNVVGFPICLVAESLAAINEQLPSVKLRSGEKLQGIICEEIPYDWRLATDLGDVFQSWTFSGEWKVTASHGSSDRAFAQLDERTPSEDERKFPFLADIGRRLLHRRRQASAAPDAYPFLDPRPAVAAHSTGGVVLRGLLALETPVHGQVDHAFFINVPFLGAPKAEYVYLTGNADLAGGAITQEERFRWIAPDIPVVYLLAPWGAYEAAIAGRWSIAARRERLEAAVANGSYGTYRGDLWEDPVKRAEPATTKDPHRKLDFNDDLGRWAESYYLSCVAAEQLRALTAKPYIFTSISEEEGTLMSVDTSQNPVSRNLEPRGDETVPWLSQAHPATIWQNATLMCPVQSNHTAVLKQPNWIWRQVCRILLGGPTEPAANSNSLVSLDARPTGLEAIRSAVAQPQSVDDLKALLSGWSGQPSAKANGAHSGSLPEEDTGRQPTSRTGPERP